jgi:UDP-glucose 4-epimerase
MLADTEYQVVGIARRKPPSADVYRFAQWHQLDLVDRKSVIRLQKLFTKADCVVHLAWAFQPSRNTSYLDAVGIRGSQAVLTAAHAAGVDHLIHMSSIATYAAGRHGQPVDESWSTAGMGSSAYSRGKSTVEALLDDYERRESRGVVITRMRPGFIAQRHAAAAVRRYSMPSYFDPRWLRLFPVFPLVRSLVIPVIHADDVADAIVRAIERQVRGPFNLSADAPVRSDDIARIMGARPVHVPPRLLRPLVSASWGARLQPVDPGWMDLALSVPLLNTERARRMLDWSPQHGALEALTEVAVGLLDHAGTASPALSHRSLLDSIVRDLIIGSITTREVP